MINNSIKYLNTPVKEFAKRTIIQGNIDLNYQMFLQWHNKNNIKNNKDNLYKLYNEYINLNKIIKKITNRPSDINTKLFFNNNFNRYNNYSISNKYLIKNNKILISNAKSNDKSNDIIDNDFINTLLNNNYKIKLSNYYHEGSNNCIFSHSGNTLWFGYNNLDIYIDKILELREFFNLDKYSLIPVNLNNKYFNKLNMCLMSLNKDQIMLYPKAFDRNTLNIIYVLFNKKNILVVDDEDAYNLCCNSVIIDNNIIINSISKKLEYTLRNDFNLNPCIINFNTHNKIYNKSISNFIINYPTTQL
jgi:hypothetical protein